VVWLTVAAECDVMYR